MAAFLIVPAVELAAILPLTPGNIGVAGAAVAFALRAQGVEGDLALASGIAFNAVETLASMAFGSVGALYLAAPRRRRGGGRRPWRRRPRAPRWPAPSATPCSVPLS